MGINDAFFRMRLPEGLKAQLQDSARLSHRSVNAEIVARLEESYRLGLRAEPAQQADDDAANGRLEKQLSKISDQEKQQMLDALKMLRKLMSDTGNSKSK